MKKEKFTEFYDEVLPDLPGAPEKTMVLNAIRDAAIDFCHGTRVWQEFTDPVTVTASDEKYSIPVPRNSKAVRMERVWYQNNEIRAVNEDQINRKYPHYWPDETASEPIAAVQIEPDCFYLTPRPAGTIVDAVKILVSLKPLRSSDELPAFIRERYQDAIVAGAKARLMLQQQKPWSNPQLGLVYKQEFSDAIGAANADAFKAFNRARPRSKPIFQ